MSIRNNYPNINPTLDLDFALSRRLDPRITFTRSSTATRVNSSGLIETTPKNQPRIDYDPTTKQCKGLLIEETRTNLLTYSEQFDNAAWTKSNSTVTANATIAPDGTTTSDKLVEDTATNTHLIQQTPTFTLNAIYTQSVYAKAGERTVVQLRSTSLTTFSASFDLSNGTYSQVTANTTASITNVGNGWYRCSITFTAGASGATAARIALMQNATTQSYTGDGTSGIYFWGAQLEAGAFPTSYIPTTTAAVTRAADNASMVGTNFSSWYNQSEGTIFSEWILNGDNTSINVYNINDGTGTNLIRARYNSAGSAIDNAVIVGGTVQTPLSTSNQIILNNQYKNAMAYKQNDFARSASGTLITATSGNLPTVTQINIGTSATGVEQLNGHIQCIRFYPIRLPNDQLQTLTQ